MGKQRSAWAELTEPKVAGILPAPAPRGLRDHRSGPVAPAARAQPTDLPGDIDFLAEAGIPRSWLEHAATIALDKNLEASEVLIRRGLIERDRYERHLAAHVGAAYQAEGPDPADIPTIAFASTDRLSLPGVIERGPTGSRLFVSPEASGYERAAMLARAEPATFRRAVFTSRKELRNSLFAMARTELAAKAIDQLAKKTPLYSARQRLTARQSVFLLCVLAAWAAGLLVQPTVVAYGTAIGFTGFYFAIAVLRTVLILRIDRTVRVPSRPYRPEPAAPEDFPVYSILVALYREAGQVGSLIAALQSLDWPADRKEVFLVCEEDDPDTLEAIHAHGLPDGFTVVPCPPATPRTKPKALQFALALCSGEFIVIYDAEDRPDPLQLREAWDRMRADGPKLACLQAPLLVHNSGQNWLTRMFAIEYLTQFCGTLPALESLAAPLPLGGTSNHFRGLMTLSHPV